MLEEDIAILGNYYVVSAVQQQLFDGTNVIGGTVEGVDIAGHVEQDIVGCCCSIGKQINVGAMTQMRDQC